MSLSTSTWQGILLAAGIAVALIIVVNGLIGRASRRAQARIDGPKADARRQRLRFGAQIAQIGIVIMGVVLFAHAIPVLRPVGTALLASASVLTIVLGIAAQSTLGNLLAGVSILMFRPFEPGDRIQLSAPEGVETGVVETINLGNTVVVTFDHRRIVVPNGQLVNQTTINLTSVDERILSQISINVGYQSDIDTARRVIGELIEAAPDCEEFDSVLVTELGPYYVTLTAFAWCVDSFAARRLQYATYEQALIALPLSGVDIPIPASTVALDTSHERQ